MKATLSDSFKDINKQLQTALKMKATHILISGETELNDNTFIIKNLLSRDQKTITQEEVLSCL